MNSQNSELSGRRVILLLSLVATAFTFALSTIIVELLYIWKTFSLGNFVLVLSSTFVSAAIMVIRTRSREREKVNNDINKKSYISNEMDEDIVEGTRYIDNHSYTEIQESNIKELQSYDDTKRSKKQRKREKKQKRKQEERMKQNCILKSRERTNENINEEISIDTKLKDNFKSYIEEKKYIMESTTPSYNETNRLRCNASNTVNRKFVAPKDNSNLRKISLMNRFTNKLNKQIDELYTSGMSADPVEANGHSLSLTFSTPLEPLDVNKRNDKVTATKEEIRTTLPNMHSDKKMFFRSSSFFSSPQNNDVVQPLIAKEYSLFGSQQFNSCLVWPPIRL